MIEHYHHTGSVNPEWLRAVREFESDFSHTPALMPVVSGTAIEGPMASAEGSPSPLSSADGPSRLTFEELFHRDGRDLSDRTMDERVDALEQFRANARREFPNVTLSQMAPLEAA